VSPAMPDKPSQMLAKTLLLTLLALICFAANSVLCRLALGTRAIDAASFTSLRLFSGSLILLVIWLLNKGGRNSSSKGSWLGSAMLFIYAITFSFAYITLETGTGALILFGAVQISIILLSMLSGNRLRPIEWLGICAAFGGFAYLVLPGVSTPSALGFILMTLAGIAWGAYTLIGRGSQNPLADTAFNFIRTLPAVALLLVLTLANASLSARGVFLAALSGAVASGIGYVIWYSALRGLTSTMAAVVQLFVPVIAALGGIAFMPEAVTLRLIMASALILGGILCVLLGRR
jgi:drug/metabolite transporter (DMT)-like permease